MSTEARVACALHASLCPFHACAKRNKPDPDDLISARAAIDVLARDLWKALGGHTSLDWTELIAKVGALSGTGWEIGDESWHRD